jgi:O-antigen/teichoic acid export membrane protein
MLGKAVSMVGVLFVGILVGRYLGPEKYGLMNYVISFVAIFEVLSEFGLSNIEIREMAREPKSRDAIMGTSFALRAMFAFAAYLLLSGIVSWTESDSYTRKVIMAYGLCLFAFPFNVTRNYFTSIVKNEYVVKSQIARTMVGALIKIVLLWRKTSLTWFILAAGFDFYLLATGYAQAYRTQVGRFRDWRFDARRIPFLLAESFPLLLSGAALIVYQRIDQVMIKHLVNKEGVGYFATAAMFLNVVLFLPTVFVQTVAPLLVQLRQKNVAAYRQKAEEVTGGVIWLSVLMALGVTVAAPWMIGWTYGAKYLAAIPILQVLIWKTVGMALSTASGHLIIIEGIQKLTVLRNLIGCIACVGLNWILLPRWGVMGAAWATLVTVALSGFLANALIPPYRNIFLLQVRALVTGWKGLFKIRSLFGGGKEMAHV